MKSDEAARETGRQVELERVNRLYSVLSHVTESILRIHDEHELFEAACRIAVEDGGFTLAWIGFVDAETGRVNVAAKYGRDEGYLDSITISLDETLPEGRGPTAVSLRECRPFINNDTENSLFMAPWRDEQLRRGMRSSASFPLKVAGSCVGVITLYAGVAGYFDDEEVRLLTALADDFSFALEAAEMAKQRAAALEELQRSRDELEDEVRRRTAELTSAAKENARLLEAERRSQEDARADLAGMRRLQKLAALSLTESNMESVLNEILDAAIDISAADFGNVQLLDPESGDLHIVVQRGFPKYWLKFWDNVSHGQGACGTALERGKRAIVEDVERSPIFVGKPALEIQLRAGVHAVQSTPLISRSGKPVGMFSTHFKAPHRFDDRTLRLLDLLGRQAADIIDRARLFEAERTSRREAQHRVAELDALIDALPNPVQLHAEDGSYRRVNEAVISLFGFDPTKATREEIASRVHARWPDGTPLTPENMPSSRALAGEAVRDVEYVVTDAQGCDHDLLMTAVPFVVEGQVHGAILSQLDITARKEAERRLAESRAELETELLRTTLLKEIASAAASTTDLRELGSRILDVASRLLQASIGMFFRVDEAAGLARPLASFGFPAGSATADEDLPIDETSMGGRSIITGEVLVSPGEEAPPRTVERVQATGKESHRFVTFPAKAFGKVVGMLGLGFAGESMFGEAETALYQAIGDQVGVAIENARLFEAERATGARLALELDKSQAILKAAEALSESLDLDAVLSTFLDALMAETGQTRGGFGQYDDVGKSLTVLLTKGEKAARPGLVLPLEKLSAHAQEALETQRTRVVDYDALREKRQHGLSDELEGHLALSIPLVLRGRTVGIAMLDSPGERREFSERDVEVAEAISAYAAAIIDNARLFEAEARAARTSESLSKVNEILLEALTPDEVIARLVNEVSEAAGADKCLVVEIDGEAYTVTHVRGVRPGLVGERMTTSFYPGFGLAAQEKRPVLIEDAWEDSRTNKEFVVPYELRALQLVPIFDGEEVHEVLALAYDEPRTFDAEDVAFSGRMSAAMSAAMRNARLYQSERNIADRLQEALLTLPAEVPGIEFAHAYRSAAEEARVGGDFYDLFELSADHIGVIVGDVAGKGLDAAALTSMVKNTIRAHATERGKTPSRILELTNEVVFKATATEAFVTVFFGIVDCRDGRLVYGNAGHTTGAVVSGDGRVARLSVTGPLLGAFPDVTFEQAEARLDLDDLLFLYTDGLTEARRDHDLYGEERLFVRLSSIRDGHPGDVIRLVVDDVLAFAGGQLRDDLAILAVRRVQPGEEAPHQQKLEM